MRLGLTPWDFSDLSAASLTAQASFAEAHGYTSFWLPENHFNDAAIPEPLMLLAAAAAGTHSIRLATTSFLLPLRHPLLAAEQVAVLDRLSHGRVLLGVGRGYSNPVLLAFNVEPAGKRAQFEWVLEIMIRAWSGAPVSVEENGAPPVVLDPLPLQRPHPPIWIAAFGPKALAQAGRLGMPYLASPIETLAQLEANFALHEEAVAAAEHAPIETRPVMRTIFVSEDRATVAAVRERLGRITLPTGNKAGANVEEWAIVGDAAYVADELARYREALGVTDIVVTRLRLDGIPIADLQRSVARIADIV